MTLRHSNRCSCLKCCDVELVFSLTKENDLIHWLTRGNNLTKRRRDIRPSVHVGNVVKQTSVYVWNVVTSKRTFAYETSWCPSWSMSVSETLRQSNKFSHLKHCDVELVFSFTRHENLNATSWHSTDCSCWKCLDTNDRDLPKDCDTHANVYVRNVATWNVFTHSQ